MSCMSNEPTDTTAASRSSSSSRRPPSTRPASTSLPAGEHQDEPTALEGAGQEPGEQQRAGVGNVGIVDHQQHRGGRRALGEEVGHRGEAGEAVRAEPRLAGILGQQPRGVRTPELVEHGGPRPQRWRAPVGPAPPPHDGEPVARHPLSGFFAQGRLPDPGVTPDDQESAEPVTRSRAGIGERRQLHVAPNEPRVPDRPTGHLPKTRNVL